MIRNPYQHPAIDSLSVRPQQQEEARAPMRWDEYPKPVELWGPEHPERPGLMAQSEELFDNLNERFLIDRRVDPTLPLEQRLVSGNQEMAPKGAARLQQLDDTLGGGIAYPYTTEGGIGRDHYLSGRRGGDFGSINLFDKHYPNTPSLSPTNKVAVTGHEVQHGLSHTNPWPGTTSRYDRAREMRADLAGLASRKLFDEQLSAGERLNEMDPNTRYSWLRSNVFDPTITSEHGNIDEAGLVDEAMDMLYRDEYFSGSEYKDDASIYDPEEVRLARLNQYRQQRGSRPQPQSRPWYKNPLYLALIGLAGAGGIGIGIDRMQKRREGLGR